MEHTDTHRGRTKEIFWGWLDYIWSGFSTGRSEEQHCHRAFPLHLTKMRSETVSSNVDLMLT